MGLQIKEGRPDEYPQHTVHVDGFYMDATEVTNAQFMEFVKATGYRNNCRTYTRLGGIKKTITSRHTQTCRQLCWWQPPLVFTPPSKPVALNDVSQWWQWVKGADWKHPEGPGSSIKGKRIILWYRFRGTMQWPTPNGRVSDCQLKQSGSGLPAQG